MYVLNMICTYMADVFSVIKLTSYRMDSQGSNPVMSDGSFLFVSCY